MKWLYVVACLFLCGYGFSQTFTVEADDLLRFNPEKLNLETGTTITLVIKNKGRIASQKHLFIILKAGVDVDQFGNNLEGQRGNLTPQLRQSVLLASKALGPGEEEKLTFRVPEPGVYAFICGSPGHHSVSRGEIHVR